MRKNPKMKHFIQSGRALLLLIPFLTVSCIQEILNLETSLTEDISFEIATDLLANPVILQFYHASDRTPLSDVEVTVLQTDFSAIYSLAGSLNLTPAGGLLLLGVRKSEIPEDMEPMRRITLSFRASGFFEEVHTILVADDATQVYNVALRPMDSGQTSGMMSQMVDTDAGAPVAVSFAANSGRFQFDPNTSYLNSLGDTLTGQAELQLEYYLGTIENKLLLQRELMDQELYNGQGEMTRMDLNPIAVLDIDLIMEGQAVRRFSYPLEITLPVEAGLYNPLTRAAVAPGDYIPAFSRSGQSTVWEAEGFGVVRDNNGQLEATFNLPHLSRWVFGFSRLGMNSGFSEECQVMVRFTGQVPEPYTGTYQRQEVDTIYKVLDPSGFLVDSVAYKMVPVDYHYPNRPEYTVISTFPGCLSGMGFDLSSVIRQGEREARNYFLAQDSILFKDLTFERDVRVYTAEEVEVCPNYSYADDRVIRLFLESNASVSAMLNYQYANVFGNRQVDLLPGTNMIYLPYPTFPLITEENGFFGQASFEVSFGDGCRQVVVNRPVSQCDLVYGVRFGINVPVAMPQSSVSLKVAAACPNTENNDILVRPTIPVLYRPHCPADPNAPYQYLGSVRDGVLDAVLPLAIGGSYDFKLNFDQAVREIRGITIPATSANYNVDGQPITIEVADGKVLIDLGTIAVPEEVCDLLGG